MIEPNHFGFLMEQLHPCQEKWEQIALGLRFKQSEISCIKADLSKMIGGPSACLQAVIGDWMNWAGGDARGSADKATLEALKKAVRNAGYPKVADTLTLREP